MTKVAELYSGPEVAPEDVLSVYVIFNGTLGMTSGKIAAMSFHCGWLVGDACAEERYEATAQVYASWVEQGRRVVTRIAETDHVFERVTMECSGYIQHDEGLTEVAHGSATAFVTVPYRRDSIPRILTHKRCQLYRG